MKRTIYFVCFAVIIGSLAVLTTSCSEKNKAIRQLEELAEDVQENGNSYGFSEWQDVFKQYQSINAIIDKHNGEYTQKQRSRINHARATIKQAAKDAISNTLDLIPGLKETLLDLYNALFENITEKAKSSDSIES